MQHILNNERFLSISILLLPESKLTGTNGLDAIEMFSLTSLLNKFIQPLSRTICKCYKLDYKHQPFIATLDPIEATKGIVSIYYSFLDNDKYQKNLLLNDTQLNSTLLDYFESAVFALYVEELLCSTDNNPSYKYNESLGSIIRIENNIINYSTRSFPSIVRAMGTLLKKLHKINPDYNLLICNKTHHLFANSIETHSTPISIENKIITEVIGRASPIYNSAEISHFCFYEHNTNAKHILISSDKSLSTILTRAAQYEDPIAILVSLIKFTDRNRLLPKKYLKLHDISTKTRESREELKKNLKPLL